MNIKNNAEMKAKYGITDEAIRAGRREMRFWDSNPTPVADDLRDMLEARDRGEATSFSQLVNRVRQVEGDLGEATWLADERLEVINDLCAELERVTVGDVVTYRKRPVEVQAMRLVGSAGNTEWVTSWMNHEGYPWLVGDYTKPETLKLPDQLSDDDSKPEKGIYIDPANGSLMIRTLEGDMRAAYGDWIIRGVEGEFYPCRDDIFIRTYEVAQ